MTIIFNKRTGNIKFAFSGDLQHIDTLFPEEAEDYKKIWDEIVVPDDLNVINNMRMFKIDIDTHEIKIISGKYGVAN